MANPGLTDAQMSEAASAFQKYGTKKEAAEALGLHVNTFNNRLGKAAKIGLCGYGAVMPGFEVTQVSSTEDAKGEVKSRSIQQKPQTGGKFNLPEGHAVKGVSSLMDGQGNVKAQWVKTANERDPIETARVIAETIAGFDFKPLVIPEPAQVDADLVTVYPLADFHIGLLAWGKETGQDWGLDIAERQIMPAVQRCIQASPNSKQGVVLGLGDMLHFDGYEPTTSRSKNFLDADGRYPKVLKTACEMIVQTVALALEKHETVLVRILPGNHDNQSAIALSLALSMKFENSERVTVDDSPSRFWWWRWGKVFLGATHGDKAKMKDLPMVMASDRPADWAASTYRKIFSGHIHHESRIEEGGVIVESMRAPVARDAYHAGEKYRAGRSIYSETFDLSGACASRVSINL